MARTSACGYAAAFITDLLKSEILADGRVALDKLKRLFKVFVTDVCHGFALQGINIVWRQRQDCDGDGYVR
jgi:hypothetical protein